MNPGPTVRALTLDVGHTLLFAEPSLGEIYAEVAAAFGVAVEPQAVEESFVRNWRQEQSRTPGLLYGTTHDDGLRFWLRVNRGMFTHDEFPDGRLTEFVSCLYESFASPSRWRVNPSFDPLLAACRERSVKVGLLSNWDRRLRDLITALGWPERVDSVVISAECGREKPDRAIFLHAAADLGVPTDAVLHVGDTWEDDIVGAVDAGMQAAWFAADDTDRPVPLPGVRVIGDLLDVVPLLGN